MSHSKLIVDVRSAIPFFAILSFAILAFSGPVSADTKPWTAGVARANITPAKPLWMSGYGSRDHVAEGKLTDLWAKALVLEDGHQTRVALITLDLVGIDRDLSLRICKSIEAATGIARAEIAICTSHTHTGPVVGRNLAPLHYLQIDKQLQRDVDAYAIELHDKVVAMVKSAADQMAPHQLHWGSGFCSVAVNRRNNLEANVPKTRAANMLKGPTDHDVPVLSVRRADDNGLTAVIFGYACHATVLSFYQWSGDYPGFAQSSLEASHPGCQAMFWAGCGADQNPLPRRKIEQAKQYGARLAGAVNEVLQANMSPLAPQLKAHYAEVPLPLAALPSRDQLAENANSKNRFEAARAKMLIGQIDSGKPLSATYPYPVQTWRFGDDIQWVTLGGEVVVDYALRLKAELLGKKTWVAGYSNDVMAYIPSRRVLREGGYEGGSSMVYYGLPTIWDAAIENLIVEEVRRQLAQ